MKMGSISKMAAILLLILPVISLVNGRLPRLPKRVFDVTSYITNGARDITQASLRAWSDACQHQGGGRVLIPRGTYLMDSVRFVGPCSGPMDFYIRGVLIAPTDPNKFFTDTWIGFRYVAHLKVSGGGVLDGQGFSAWRYNDCARNPNCRPLPATLRFDFVMNSKVGNLLSVNSKNAHINLFACYNMNITHMRLSAPGDSPNTDGIHMGLSSRINIAHSQIHTGDDCIAMIAGSQGIDISDVVCGPGHGISIGSIGRTHEKDHVNGIHVRNCTFIGADNGLRIKTWAPSLYTVASDIRFEDITVIDTGNPIFIDQQYCPSGNCRGQSYVSSDVQIRDVTFQNVRGTSSTKIAVNIQCSQSQPCQNIQLVDIDLSYHGRGGPATSLCSHLSGRSWGKQNPNGCL